MKHRTPLKNPLLAADDSDVKTRGKRRRRAGRGRGEESIGTIHPGNMFPHDDQSSLQPVPVLETLIDGGVRFDPGHVPTAGLGSPAAA